MKNIDILVVDDEEDVYLSTKLALELLEYDGIKTNVCYSESAASAIERINEQKFQLIFVDIIMESVHAGYKVIDFINKNKSDPPACIFVRSGQPGNVPDEFVSLLDSIDGYLNKTDCTMQKLHEIVKMIA